MPNIVKIAENLPETAYKDLTRQPKYIVKTEPRSKPANVKERIVKKFRNFFIMLPCQIVKTGRRLFYRLLGWNEYLDIFFRAVENFRHPLRC